MTDSPQLTLNSLFEALDGCEDRHRRTLQDDVGRLMLGAGSRYAAEVEGFLSLYRRDAALAPILDPLISEIRDYALWLRWLGWNIAALGPPLYGSSGVAIDALAFGLLAYAAGRLIDDGFDNHESYKGRHPSLVGTLRGRIAGAPTYRACVQSVFVGFSLFHYALRRMRQADHCDWADQVSRLFDALSVGVVAEGLLVAPVGVDVYHQVIRRKSVAYNLILYKTFLAPLKPALRGELLRTLAEMDELAQLVNDYVDLNEDVLAGTLNALTFGVYHRVDLESVILSKATAAWMATESLNESVRDAMAVMIRSVLSPYRERVVSNAV